MTDRRNALTPDALAMMDAIARTGSFAAAARELGKVPSALTYNVRQLEDALDVLLFDRRTGQAKLTAAGEELLNEGRRLLSELDAVANRVKRVASGWESHLTIVADDIISSATLLELSQAFYDLRTDEGEPHGTRLRVRTEVLAGTWDALLTGMADLAVGVLVDSVPSPTSISTEVLGEVPFIFTVAPHHPLAKATDAITDQALVAHRAIAVADTARSLNPFTIGLLAGQDVLTVSNLSTKIEALTRGLGCGFMPEPWVRTHLAAGSLVHKPTKRGDRVAKFGAAWRTLATPQPQKAPQGLGLQWWVQQLKSTATKQALLTRYTARA